MSLFCAVFLAVRFLCGASCSSFLESTLVVAVYLLVTLILILEKKLATGVIVCRSAFQRRSLFPVNFTGIQSAPSTFSSSSSSTHRRKYDLFLSFRGKDTRYEFADTLFTTLKRWGIIVFRDDEGLQRGKEINPALEVAIKESRNAAIIVSPDFIKSKACLFELNVIMECRRMERLSVFPVFYHIDPSDVGKLTKDFKNYFNSLEDDPDNKEVKWEYWKCLLDKIADWPIDPKLNEYPVESSGSALKKLSDVSAWVVGEKSYTNPIIDEICRAIWVRTINDSPRDSDTFVGIESRAANVMRLLKLEKEDEVHVVGICGMGGIGKSILAEFIYKRLLPCFEAGHFSHPIGKKKSKKYLASVQKEIISKILPEVATNLPNSTFEVKNVFRTKLREGKVLIVLDDLWNNLQVEELAGNLKWFGPGSRIIITSRIYDLSCLNKDNIYDVEMLNEYDALMLFCMKAFKQPQPKEGFEQLSKKVVDHAKGHPFALHIFGSYLSNKKTKARWDGYLKELGTKVEDDIADTLQISLEELDKGINFHRKVSPSKELFLDIACFFNRCLKDDVLDILKGVEGFGDNLEHILSVLEEKSLIKILDGKMLWMHDFLVDLGRQIGKSTRLLQSKDIVRVLESPSIENSQVKGIVLKDFSKERRTFHLQALSAMVELRVLHISCNHNYDNFDDQMEEFDEDLDDDDEMKDQMQGHGHFLRIKWIGDYLKFKLSANLRIMEWEHYPFKSLPRGSNFAPTNLVMLDLSFSHINKLWDGNKSFPKLKLIDLTGCRELIETPDMSGIPNLEKLHLEGCNHLSMVHSSIGGLKQLKYLRLALCKRLKQFPDIHSQSLKVLSFAFCQRLKRFPNILFSSILLSHLDIQGTNFKEHPFLSTEFPSLVSFNAEASYVKEFPCLVSFYAEASYMKGLSSCIASSKKLKQLSFSCPTNFRFPSWFSELSSLKHLTLTYCNFSDEPNDLVEVTTSQKTPLRCSTLIAAQSKLPLSLTLLVLRQCQTLDVLESPELISVRNLDLRNNKFEKVPDIVGELSCLKSLDLSSSSSLKALSKLPLNLQELDLVECESLEVFDNQMTEQFSKEMLWSSGCSFMVAYIGFEGKPYKILYLHPETPPYIGYSNFTRYDIKSVAACGPTLKPRITDWFVHRSSNSGKEIQIPMDWNSKSKPWVCALLIVYEVHGHNKRESRKQKLDELENLNIGASKDSNNICPEFVCQLQLNEGSPKYTFVVCVPEVVCVGSHGLWVCINNPNSSQEPESMGWSCRVSITASSKKVVLKEGGARLLSRDAHSKLVEVVTKISRCDWDSRSLDLSLNNYLSVKGRISPRGWDSRSLDLSLNKRLSARGHISPYGWDSRSLDLSLNKHLSVRGRISPCGWNSRSLVSLNNHLSLAGLICRQYDELATPSPILDPDGFGKREKNLRRKRKRRQIKKSRRLMWSCRRFTWAATLVPRKSKKAKQRI